jgi:hypothetical protein
LYRPFGQITKAETNHIQDHEIAFVSFLDKRAQPLARMQGLQNHRGNIVTGFAPSNLKGLSSENFSNLVATTSQDFKHIGQKMNQDKPRTAHQNVTHPQVVPMKVNPAAIRCAFRWIGRAAHHPSQRDQEAKLNKRSPYE